MSGNEVETHAARETRLRLEREGRLRQFISENRPVAVIAKLEALDFSYAKLLIRKLVKDEKLDYNPPKITKSGEQPIVGLTEDSERFRGRLADRLYALGDDHRAIALGTGIMLRSQKFARDRPFNYDWTVSNLERVARASNKGFRQFMLEALLTPEEQAKAARCGIM